MSLLLAQTKYIPQEKTKAEPVKQQSHIAKKNMEKHLLETYTEAPPSGLCPE
jgi:hypothetical protein